MNRLLRQIHYSFVSHWASHVEHEEDYNRTLLTKGWEQEIK